MKKRIISMLLAIVMVVGMLPMPGHVHAVEAKNPTCTCGTDDAAIHAVSCPAYVAPENPECFCAEKCTERNEWCDVCGFDISNCSGTDEAVTYQEADGCQAHVKITVVGDATAKANGGVYADVYVRLTGFGLVKYGDGREDMVDGTIHIPYPSGYPMCTFVLHPIAVEGYSVTMTGATEGTYYEQKYPTSVTVTYTSALTGISVTSNPAKTSYMAGEKFDPAGMVITAAYQNGTSKAVTGYTVTNGDSLTAGQTSVTISYTENGITKTTVVPIQVTDKYNITISNTIQNGTVRADVTKAAKGDSVTLTVTPAKGYLVDTVTYNGTAITPVAGVYSFTMPGSDVTVSATFKACPHESYEDGKCTVCGTLCSHSGGTATCQKKAVCTVCGSEYGEVDKTNHASEEFTYTDNKNGLTHKKDHKCCGATADEAENHTYDPDTGLCTLCGAQAVAKVGGSYFTSLADAAGAVTETDSAVKVFTDVTIGEDETVTFAAFATLEVAEGVEITCNGTVKIGEKDGIIFENKLYYLGVLCESPTGEIVGIDLDTATPNTYYPAGDGYAIFEGNGTLRLHNAVITTPDDDNDRNTDCIRHSTGDLTIYFSGNNQLTSGNTDDSTSGIYVAGDLTLTAVGENAELTVQCGNSGGSPDGINAKSLTVNGGTVTAIGGSTDGATSAGIYVETNLTVNSGTVYAHGGSGVMSVGVLAAGDTVGTIVVADGAALYATGGEATMSAGVWAATVSGNVNALGLAVSETEDAATMAYAYTVYGEVVLTEDLTISNPYIEIEGEVQILGTATFTVPEGTSLTVNEGVTLDLSALEAENILFSGTIINNGTIILPDTYAYDTIPEKLNGTVAIGEHSYTLIDSKWICAQGSHVPKADTYLNLNGDQHSFACTVCGSTVTEAHTGGSYSASGNVIADLCTGCGAAIGTATLTAETATYNGTAQETATVAYSDGWTSGELTVAYENNTNAGTATASITLGEATATTDFTIEKRELKLKLTDCSKEYDGTDLLTRYTVELENFIFYDEGDYIMNDYLDYDDVYDDVDVDAEKLTVTLSDCVPGAYTTATVSGITLTGETAGNYTIAETLENVPISGYYGDFEIGMATITITSLDQNVELGAEIDQNAYFVEGLPQGHEIRGVVLEKDGNRITVNTDAIVIVNNQGAYVTDYFYMNTYNDGILTEVCQGHSFNADGFCATGQCQVYEAAKRNDNGTEEEYDDYYEIANAGQLFWFAEYVNNVKNDARAVLTANITISEGKEWTPIGSSYPAYTGSFDGQGYTISGLYVNQPEQNYVGLFGNVSYNPEIKNLTITNSTFIGRNYVGALAGYGEVIASNIAIGENVTVQGNSYVGSMIGYNSGTLRNSYACSDSLVGYMYPGYGSIENCYFLSDTEDSYDGTTAMTADRFASGEVAYLLQAGQEGEPLWDEENEDYFYDDEGNYIYGEAPHVWGQKIGTEDYPVLGGRKVFFDQETNTYYNEPAILGDLDGDGDVDAYDLTLLARHVGGIELVEGQALLNADVDGDDDVDAYDLTKHARYVGGIITSWDQE